MLVSGLGEGFVTPSASGEDADGGPGGLIQWYESARWQSNHGLCTVTDDDGVVTARACELAAVTGIFLHIEHRGPFRNVADGECIPDGQWGLCSAEDLAPHAESLICKGPDLFAGFVTDPGKGCRMEGVVFDIHDRSLPMGKVFCLSFVPVGGSCITMSLSTPLCCDSLSHEIPP